MKKSKSMTLAVTVDSYYLDPQQWSIKLMTIVRTKTGVFVWSTKKTICIHHELSKLAPKAIEYSIDNNIPYFYGLNRGMVVTRPYQQFIEQHFGSKLSDLI